MVWASCPQHVRLPQCRQFLDFVGVSQLLVGMEDTSSFGAAASPRTCSSDVVRLTDCPRPSLPRLPQFALAIFEDGNLLSQIPLCDRVILVGRGRTETCPVSPKVELWLCDPSLSPEHASISVAPDAGGALVEDLHSEHGTFIDGERLQSSRVVPMSQHSCLVFGHCALEFRLVCLVPAPNPTRKCAGAGADRGAGRHHHHHRHREPLTSSGYSSSGSASPVRHASHMPASQAHHAPPAASSSKRPHKRPRASESREGRRDSSHCSAHASSGCGSPTEAPSCPSPSSSSSDNCGGVACDEGALAVVAQVLVGAGCAGAPAAPTASTSAPASAGKSVRWSPDMLRVHEVAAIQYPPDFFEAIHQSVIFRNMLDAAMAPNGGDEDGDASGEGRSDADGGLGGNASVAHAVELEMQEATSGAP